MSRYRPTVLPSGESAFASFLNRGQEEFGRGHRTALQHQDRSRAEEDRQRAIRREEYERAIAEAERGGFSPDDPREAGGGARPANDPKFADMLGSDQMTSYEPTGSVVEQAIPQTGGTQSPFADALGGAGEAGGMSVQQPMGTATERAIPASMRLAGAFNPVTQMFNTPEAAKPAQAPQPQQQSRAVQLPDGRWYDPTQTHEAVESRQQERQGQKRSMIMADLIGRMDPELGEVPAGVGHEVLSDIVPRAHGVHRDRVGHGQTLERNEAQHGHRMVEIGARGDQSRRTAAARAAARAEGRSDARLPTYAQARQRISNMDIFWDGDEPLLTPQQVDELADEWASGREPDLQAVAERVRAHRGGVDEGRPTPLDVERPNRFTAWRRGRQGQPATRDPRAVLPSNRAAAPAEAQRSAHRPAAPGPTRQSAAAGQPSQVDQVPPEQAAAIRSDLEELGLSRQEMELVLQDEGLGHLVDAILGGR